MKRAGFSLVEVMVAAAIVAVGLTAAAVLAGTLMQQEELNAASMRAADMQEQVSKLYRLDMASSTIRSLLPEPCVAAGDPPSGGYRVSFSTASPTNMDIGGVNVSLDKTTLTLVYSNPVGRSNATNVVDILRPTIRVKYSQ